MELVVWDMFWSSRGWDVCDCALWCLPWTGGRRESLVQLRTEFLLGEESGGRILLVCGGGGGVGEWNLEG